MQIISHKSEGFFMSENQNVRSIRRSNVFQVFRNAKIVLSHNWSEMVSATLLTVVSILSLLLFPLFGFVLSFFASGFVAVGYISFTLSIIKGKKPKIESIYTNFRNCLGAAALRLVMCVFVFLWSLLLIIPGIIASINYSFAMSILCEKPNVGAMDAMKESKKLVYGYRDVLFAIYLLAFFFMLVVFCFGLILPLAINAVTVLPLWSILTIAGVISAIIYVVLFLPFIEVCLAGIYLEAKENVKLENKNLLPKKPKQVKTSGDNVL